MSGPKKDWFRPVTVQLKHVTWIQWTATEERPKMDATGTGGPVLCGPVRLGPGLFPVHTTGPQNTRRGRGSPRVRGKSCDLYSGVTPDNH